MSQAICIDCTLEDEKSRSSDAAGSPRASPSAEHKNKDTILLNGAEPVMNCTICLENMEEEGPHRAACLKCGHIFGQKCIRRWLSEKRTCPQCNLRAKAGDITVLFNLPRVLPPSSNLELLQQRLKEAENEKKKLADELQQIKSAMRMHSTAAATATPVHRSSFAGAVSPQFPPSTPPMMPPNHLQQAPSFNASATNRHNSNFLQQAPSPFLWNPGCGPQIQPLITHPNAASSTQSRPSVHPMMAGQNTMGGGRTPPNSTSSVPVAGTGVMPPLSRQQPQPGCLSSGLHNYQFSNQAGCWPATAGRQYDMNHPTAKRPRLGELPGSSRDMSAMGSGQVLVETCMKPTDGQITPGWPGPTLQSQAPPCELRLTQQHLVNGARCFDMDVAAGLLVLPEVSQVGRAGAMQHRIRKLSMLCPDIPDFMPLPSTVEMVRCVALQTQRRLLLAGTKGANVLMLSTATNNRVADFKLPGHNMAFATSACWLPNNPDQALLGFSNGIVALLDLRNTSTPVEALLPTLPSPGPVHTVLGLPADILGSLQTHLSMPASVAQSSPSKEIATQPNGSTETVLPQDNQQTAGGQSGNDCTQTIDLTTMDSTQQPSVGQAISGQEARTGARMYAPGFANPGVRNAQIPTGAGNADVQRPAPGLVPEGEVSSPGHWLAASPAGAYWYKGKDVVQGWASSRMGKGTCESICVDRHSGATVLSFRQTAPGAAIRAAAAHVVLPANCGSEGSRQEAFEIGGHRSIGVMTRCCILGNLPEEAGSTWLAGADETSHAPWIWSLRSRNVVQVLDPHPSPVFQLSAGESQELGYILAACCSKELKLYSMHNVD